MNKEQQELVDAVYENYEKKIIHQRQIQKEEVARLRSQGKRVRVFLIELLTQEEFINKCKTNQEFSERWGLKIEERELSLEEKEWQLEKTNCINDIENDRIIYGHEWEKYIQEQYEGIQSNQGIKIPTKLITITYNDKTIEIYEHIG